MTPEVSFDRMFTGSDCSLVSVDGDEHALDIDRWRAEHDSADFTLFIEPCSGPTIDIGCGPGRITAGLAAHAVHAMGIDTSREAIRQARERGAVVVLRDVFAPLPGEGRWDAALLADGNVGIGGDPVALLRRVAQLVHADGRIIVELAGPGCGIRVERVQLRIDDHLTAPFDWARVGVEAIAGVAAAAGLHVESLRRVAGRHAATLISSVPSLQI